MKAVELVEIAQKCVKLWLIGMFLKKHEWSVFCEVTANIDIGTIWNADYHLVCLHICIKSWPRTSGGTHLGPKYIVMVTRYGWMN